jgi:hypothetical protein
MKRPYLLPIVVACVFLVGCGAPATESTTASEPEAMTETDVVAASEEAAPAEARNDVVYACNCGPDCDCNTVTTAPGKCSCGQDLAWAHVVKVEGDEALLCACAEGCTCAVDPADETKCGCGKDLRRVSFKGTGLHYCNCGGSCTCNFVSSEPGKCACGMDLVTSS